MQNIEDVLVYSKKLTVLYVEDNEDTREHLSEILKDIFQEVVLAEDGLDGYNKYKKYFLDTGKYFDIVMSDIEMPNMSGVIMTEKIKELRLSQIVAFFTAHNDSKHLLSAIDVGVDKFLLKPILDTDKFIQDLFVLVKKAKILHELEEKAFLLEQKSEIINNHVYMTVSDLKGRIQDASQAFLDFTGYELNEIVGKNHSIFRVDKINRDVVKNLWETILADKVWVGELKNNKKSGEEYWIKTVISPLYDKNYNKIGYTSIKENITDKKRLESLSITDGLSGLHNKRYFDSYLKKELKRSSYKKEPIALLVIDIDNFKRYNDERGHIAGDEAIRSVAKILDSYKSTRLDEVFRISGGVYTAVILDDDDEEIQKTIDFLQKDIKNLCDLSVSIGAVNIDTNKYEISSDDLFNIADSNLNIAKKKGHSKYKFEVDEHYVGKLKNIDNITKLPNRSVLVNDLTVLESEAMLILLHINQLNTIKNLYGMDAVKSLVSKKAYELTNIIVDEQVTLYNLNMQEFAILVTDKNLFEKYISLLKYSILSTFEDHDEENDQNEFNVADFTAGVAYGTNTVFNQADVTLQQALLENVNFKEFSNSQDARELEQTTLDRLKVYRRALHNGQIIPYFQPIVDVNTGEFLKFEALARIETEQGEIISPYFFLDSAKEDKSFEYFTRQMMQKVFNVFAESRANISINLTYENIKSLSMIGYIKNRLEMFGGKGITFEILESEDIEDYSVIEEFILMAKSYGCEISIDDFGSGYSNFTNIIKLNIDYIKLDGTLVQKLNNDVNVLHMVEGLLAFAQHANIKTIAEFVSSKELADTVKSLGVDYSQGYYFGEPGSAETYGLIKKLD